MASALVLSAFTGCSKMEDDDSKAVDDNSVAIVLSDSEITCGGENVTDDSTAAVYISHNIVYYEDKDAYESGNPYGEGTDADRHSAEEAAAHTVVNITEAGTYRLSGQLSKGQINVDLGDDAKTDETAVVTLILDGADISCEVAPAILFSSVYECDNDASEDTASSEVDTSKAGANIVIADDSVNNISGSHVAKIYKDNDEQKKLCKQDGAVYSYMSMNVDCENENSAGTLNIKADNEGLDSEMHLTINGGNINIYADNDGINTNEDGISVTTINGGSLHIIAGLGEEGDGIDSNGWLVINGGTVIASANPAADSGLDSDMGSYINGGTVIALGSSMDWTESDSSQVTMNLQFAEEKSSGDAIAITDTDGSPVFEYDFADDEVISSNTRNYTGAIISCPDFKTGETYNVFIGSIKQAYTGTDVMGGHGDMPQMQNPAEGFDPRENGDGGTPPELPDEQHNGDMPSPPDMQGNDGRPTPPDMQGGEMHGAPNNMQLNEGDASTEFYMQDTVNFFSGIRSISE